MRFMLVYFCIGILICLMVDIISTKAGESTLPAKAFVIGVFLWPIALFFGIKNANKKL